MTRPSSIGRSRRSIPPSRRELFEKLAAVEDRHASRWEDLFREAGRPLPPYATAFRTRALAWIARRFTPSLVLPLMLAEEGREVQSYLGMARRSTHGGMYQAAVDIASDSADARTRALGGDGAAKASPGTPVAPAACSAAWCTDSTTD